MEDKRRNDLLRSVPRSVLMRIAHVYIYVNNFSSVDVMFPDKRGGLRYTMYMYVPINYEPLKGGHN